jgi:hypothetical protein
MMRESSGDSVMMTRVQVFKDKFVSADTDQSPQDPPGSGTKRDRILLFP